MSAFFRRLAEAFGWTKKECKIVVVGLDGSGKSTLINFLKPKKLASFEVTPTVGFSEETFEKGKLRFQVFDMAGGGTYRSLWETYYKGVDAVIFVVDSTDKIRMCVAKDELDAMLAHPDVKKAAACPILFFANKMDLPRAMEPSDIMAMLQLQRIGDKAWHIQASNALTGEGVDAGVDWLAAQLSKPPSAASGKPAAAASAGAGAGAAPAPTPGTATSPAAGATGGAGAAPAR